MTTGGNIYKCPPKFENGDCYESWKLDVEIWQELTDLPKSKQALALHLSLSGRAREASTEIPISNLKADDGVDKLMEKLDSLFLLDKGRRQFKAFQNLYNFRRCSDADVGEFVNEFERVYFKFTQEGMVLPDAVMAFMLLVSSNLTENKFQLAMSAITDVNYSNMKSTLKRVFGGEFGSTGNSAGNFGNVKSEPVFSSNEHSDHTQSALYSSGSSRGRASLVVEQVAVRLDEIIM